LAHESEEQMGLEREDAGVLCYGFNT
jgi:hypothetical protein